MTTRKAIKAALNAIATQMRDDSGQPLFVHQFGSFLDNNHPLPSNQALLQRAEARHVALTPTAIREQLFPATDLALDDPQRDARPINRRVMFVAENSAARTGFENFTMFHDLSLPLNTFKLYTQVNDRRLQGAYITDALKNTLESDSEKLKAAFLIAKPKTVSLANWQEHREAAIAELMYPYAHVGAVAATEEAAVARLTANAETFVKSARIFAQECAVIKPQQLAVFGADTATVLRQMKPLFADDPQLLALIDGLKVVYHYATRRNFADWVATQQAQLLRALDLDPSQSQPFEP